MFRHHYTLFQGRVVNYYTRILAYTKALHLEQDSSCPIKGYKVGFSI